MREVIITILNLEVLILKFKMFLKFG